MPTVGSHVSSGGGSTISSFDAGGGGEGGTVGEGRGHTSSRRHSFSAAEQVN